IDGGATKYVANTSLGAINVRTYLARPDAGQKSQNNASDITGNGAYTLVGNAFCYVNRLPVASLSASPTQGSAPLTVSFDGSASTDPDGSVVTYTYTYAYAYAYSYPNTDSDAKASWKAEAYSYSKSNSNTNAQTAPNPSATRLVVPGVAISFGAQQQTLGAEMFS